MSESMDGSATVQSVEHVANDEGVVLRTPVASWDPFQVWLTRIKQPRDESYKTDLTGTSKRYW